MRVHEFASTGEAYDASQTRDDIDDGDVLHVPSENVTGFLLAAWPTAVTEASGEFHRHELLDAGEPVAYKGRDYSDSIERARQVANAGDAATLSYDDVAAATGLTTATLRRYRAIGLLPAPDELPAPDRPRWRASTIEQWKANRPGRGAPGRARAQRAPVSATQYGEGDRVRIIDPADRRKRLGAQVVRVNEGRGPLEYVVMVDGETEQWSVAPCEITRRE